MKILSFILVIIPCLLPWIPIQGAELGAVSRNTSALFQSSEPLALTINAPFKTIFRHRGSNRPYDPATMFITDADGKQVSVDLKIRVRGNFRSDWENCKYPPLKLNFKRKSLKNTILKGENKLKLVVQCKDQDKYAQYLLLEYLNYKVYQLLTDYSLDVRLARIEYYDSEKNQDLGGRPAFFIEDTGRFAKRLDLQELEMKKIPAENYDPAALNLAEMFEFFIANTDWSSTEKEEHDDNCCHNIIPFKARDGTVIPVPYDFDMAGVVDAAYAVVDPRLRINSVRQRLYRGHCQDEAILQSTINTFKARRNDIYSLYENQPGLTSENIKQTVKYYDNFYDIMQNEERLKWMIRNKCR